MNSEAYSLVKFLVSIFYRKPKKTSEKKMYCFIGIDAIVSNAIYPWRTNKWVFFSLFEASQKIHLAFHQSDINLDKIDPLKVIKIFLRFVMFISSM